MPSGDPNFKKVVDEWMVKEVYDRLQRPLQTQDGDKQDYRHKSRIWHPYAVTSLLWEVSNS